MLTPFSSSLDVDSTVLAEKAQLFMLSQADPGICGADFVVFHMNISDT